MTGCAGTRYHTPAKDVPASVAPVSVQAFAWPVSGRVVAGFGMKEDGVSLKGILIAAPKGEPVIAARDGKVVFVDPKMRGYGRTLILEHPEDFCTVYARNSEILVEPGEWVRQGQTIARVGSFGNTNAPQLYFEIRRRSKAEDPVQFLPQRPT